MLNQKIRENTTLREGRHFKFQVYRIQCLTLNDHSIPKRQNLYIFCTEEL